MSDLSQVTEPSARKRAPKRKIEPDHAHLEAIGLRTIERCAEIEGVTPQTLLLRGLPIIRRGRRRFIKAEIHDAWLRGEEVARRRSHKM